MSLSPVIQRARDRYCSLLASPALPAPTWWDTVILTATSTRQAEAYRQEIHRRLERGHLPARARYLVIADPTAARIGSGAATLHAIHCARPRAGRTLLIHSGGDARSLPQYSTLGKLFSALPLKTPWGEVSTLFDEFLALSSLWVEQMPPGLLACSGHILLVFDAETVAWPAHGVHGIAMRQPAAIGSEHGVYVLGPDQAVYACLQKPSFAEVRAAGGALSDGQVAVDTGLLHFDPATLAALSSVADSIDWTHPPYIDLYSHITLALTQQWSPAAGDSPALFHLAGVLRGVPLSATLVEGEFTHVGATALFRLMMTEEQGLARLYAAHQRLGAPRQVGVRSSGVIVDSVLEQADIGAGAVILACNLQARVRAARGCLLHGLEGISGALDVPEDTVLHQVAVRLPGGERGTVLRVYGVDDDPKQPLSAAATWLKQPMLTALEALGLTAEEVWPDVAPAERCLWNAALFPVASPDQAWACARWLLGMPDGFSAADWRAVQRLSLAGSTDYADEVAALESRARRARAQWESTAVRLALDGADIRPMLAQAPGLSALSDVARRLAGHAESCAAARPAEAASRAYQASLFHTQAGLESEATEQRARAFRHVSQAVRAGIPQTATSYSAGWHHRSVQVAAPARIDLGGGWSDTPPFCLDWGGTVLNAAVGLDGALPIVARLSLIEQPVIRCLQGADGPRMEYTDTAALFAPPGPGDPFAIARSVFQMSGLFQPDDRLPARLEQLGGGVEVTTDVNLPMGSGLGTSSILAAAALQAFHTLAGDPLPLQVLSDRVLALEQYMSTGGGWQDQAGGIFPGIKLVSSGPGLRQRLHARTLSLSAERIEELESLLVLASTGITRVAKGLLQEVVGRYLARETRAVEVLHSIKTLALEMAHAIEQADWDYFGELLDRHWALNQVLDPNTTNAPIETMLKTLRPHLRGTKLAGAGGGGFLMLLAKSPDDAKALRTILHRQFSSHGATSHDWRLATAGLETRVEPL